MDRKRTGGGHIKMDQRGSAYIDLNDKVHKVGRYAITGLFT